MSLAQGIILATLATLVVLLVRGKQSPAAIFSGVAFIFILLGYVSVDDALRQLTNSGLVTVVVLLLLSVVLDKSRLLESAADSLVRGPYRLSLVKLCGATALYSAFLNNTAVVASLIGPLRGKRLIAPVEPDELLAEGDVLVFSGDVTRLDLLARFNGLQTRGQHDDLPLDNLVEVVVASDSTLARRTLRGVDFRSQFDAAVVAVRRGSERLGGSIGTIRLAVGDTLVLVVGKDFEKRNNLARNFVIVSRRAVQKFVDPRKAWLSMAGFVAVIVLSALGVVGFLKGLLVLLAAFIVLGLAKVPELRRNIPYSIILIIASALIISEVMISSGSARLLAGWMLLGADHWGAHSALALTLVLTWLLTEMMSNNAAAALAFPVAIGVAEQLGLAPMPFVMAVLYGASCSYSTPFGYQTNLMVMSPGRYTLADYARAGFPLALVYLAICLLAIPVVFPFE